MENNEKIIFVPKSKENEKVEQLQMVYLSRQWIALMFL